MFNWYVMHSKPRQEAFLCEQLFLRKIEAYCPSIRPQVAGAVASRAKPLFPGYIFIRVDLGKFSLSELQWTPGAVGIVCYGGEPAPLADTLIKAIQERAEAASQEEAPLFKPGDVVQIEDGIFANYRAIFDRRLAGHQRVRVLLELLQGHRMHLELSAGQLRALPH